MGFGRLPLDEQLAGFRALLTRNPTLVEVLTRAAVLALPDWYLVAGCLYQDGVERRRRAAESGILDYDLTYSTARTYPGPPRTQSSRKAAGFS